MFILGAIGSTFASVGELYGTPENASMVALVGFLLVAFLLAALVYAVYAINKTKVDLHGFKKADKSIVRKYQRLSNELEKEYNAKSGPIWAEYKKKKPKANTDDEKKKLRDEYQDRLDDIKNEFRPRGKAIETDCFNEETALCKEWLDKLPSSLMWLQWTVRAICIVALLILTFMVFFHLGAQDYGKADATSPVNGWTATTIKLPHLTDGSRYVANPDGVLSAEAEDAINRTMARMDRELGIESAVIAVRHVENDDVFRFAQDIFDHYKIGKEDRGLVIVLATDDRKVRTHTGYSLEGDLTDVECKRLQDQYLVPYMKVNQPDEGLKALTEALFCYLSKKDMPVAKEPTASDDSDVDWQLLFITGSFIAWLLALWGFWDYADKKRKPIIPSGLKSGPWNTDTLPPLHIYRPAYSSSSTYSSYSSSSSSSSYSDSSSSSYSSSSCSSSGGYSGGGSGGGGATSSW